MSPNEENTETSRHNSETPASSQNSSSEDIHTLLSMIQRLTSELAAARSEIEQLRATTVQLQNQLNQVHPTNNQPTSTLTANVQSSLDFPELTTVSTPWRNPEQVSRLKEDLLQKQQQRRQQRQEAAARLLQPPSENQGFRYLYLPTKARVPVGQLRSRLYKLDINNNRILDIHCPNRNVVALLVHNDYADELRSHLRKFKVTLKDDFDPCDPMILHDPRYSDSTTEERTNIVFMHHCNRMERALRFVRAPVKFAVARYFHTKGWISTQTLQETLSFNRRANHTQPESIFFEDDNMSTVEDHNDTQSHLTVSHMEDDPSL
ncbi:hypothetical protein G6F57_007526 [Rhizopus arrhizus]|uniref:Uncharacterized protein n=1 Tax=Rhizopus oryzae TaxID=64495 RepID=A0A9P7BSI3_RHIOR|nr:hypothetical protein G6F24_005845 [Rhizopus arrhizus]KAG0909126.1 hypothetical protein G6F33_009068 [Rhizopus arrhizus]KAG0937770.1 hypothetical protein G6F30_008111 [Rhizopus arrhizus]KAG0980513.1 hypothetical protein G6F29_007765 [Rhizopus arrhizus]KAG0992750.1 hypothetical protein G6F28_007342 [Rhizopus arrhizus]